KWSLVNASGNLITRPFYYTTLGVDPTNPDLLFIGDEGWFKSVDGGKSFRPSPAPHGDHHDIWINPRNSQYMIQSNDGGANVSLDGGRTWSVQSNQPTAEIYQVAVDNQYPYRVYGSQYVHRTRDGGVHWERISPDLTAKPEGTQGASGEPITRDATGEEVYSTLYSIRESPVQKGVIWAGSNDGLIHVSRDDGKTW